ncbi:MAG: transporter substrate-binding domain-containing protein [Actinobacteria bacterium]|nr:MAG: transporter substrate-binding domain-containing protein [Actinomycetota bacterium]
MSRYPRVIVGIVVLSIAAAACASGGGTSSKTMLDQVKASGKLRVATDPAYPPQSSYDKASGKWEGFDVDVATEVAKRLGVKLQFVTPSWDIITAGHWNGRWDVSVGSMTPIAERQKVLDFTRPYYYVPAVVVVKNDSSITSFDQLSGKSIGSCDPCTYSLYIKRTLNIPGFPATFILPTDMKFTGYDTDTTALDQLQVGRLDAVLTSLTTADGAIKAGKPFKLLGDPVFYEPDSIAVDKSAGGDPSSFASKISSIVGQMQSDGTLSALSKKWFDGLDLTVKKSVA